MGLFDGFKNLFKPKSAEGAGHYGSVVYFDRYVAKAGSGDVNKKRKDVDSDRRLTGFFASKLAATSAIVSEVETNEKRFLIGNPKEVYVVGPFKTIQEASKALEKYPTKVKTIDLP